MPGEQLALPPGRPQSLGQTTAPCPLQARVGRKPLNKPFSGGRQAPLRAQLSTPWRQLRAQKTSSRGGGPSSPLPPPPPAPTCLLARGPCPLRVLPNDVPHGTCFFGVALAAGPSCGVASPPPRAPPQNRSGWPLAKQGTHLGTLAVAGRVKRKKEGGVWSLFFFFFFIPQPAPHTLRHISRHRATLFG